MADETYPEELKYFVEHDWVRIEDGEAVFGVTWFAQDALGEIVYVEVPDVGTTTSAGNPYGSLESVKAVTDVFAPLTGEVVAVNDQLIDDPELVNRDCYGDGWILRVRVDAPDEVPGLMDAPAYREHLDTA
jgi:glycine cleavage system H protein